jgi:hypothetical protein
VNGSGSSAIGSPDEASFSAFRNRAVRRLANSPNALRSTGVSVGGFSGGVDERNGTTFGDGGTMVSPGRSSRTGCSDGGAASRRRSCISAVSRATSRHTPNPR